MIISKKVCIFAQNLSINYRTIKTNINNLKTKKNEEIF